MNENSSRMVAGGGPVEDGCVNPNAFVRDLATVALTDVSTPTRLRALCRRLPPPKNIRSNGARTNVIASRMPRSLFPSDDSLPDWLHHLTLCIAVVALPAGFLFWFGIGALITGHLDPLPGPDLGQYFFGNKVLTGSKARLAGTSLVLLGTGCLTLGLSFSRLVDDYPKLRVVPWLLVAASMVVTFRIR